VFLRIWAIRKNAKKTNWKSLNMLAQLFNNPSGGVLKKPGPGPGPKIGPGPVTGSGPCAKSSGPGLGPFSTQPEGLLSNFECIVIQSSFNLHLLVKLLKVLFSI